jgi:hypothetical protein
MVGWLRIMTFSRTGNGWQIKSLQVREWAGRTLQTALGTSGPKRRGYNEATKQASPSPGDFRNRLASKDEHPEAEGCRRNERLEATA